MPDAHEGARQPTEVLDLDNAEVLRTRVAAVDKSMTPAQAAAYQRGELAAGDAGRPVAETAANAAAPTYVTGVGQPAVGADGQPVQVAPPQVAPAIPSPQLAPAAPAQPAVSPRAQDRINDLFGRARGAEDTVAQLKAENERLREAALRPSAVLPDVSAAAPLAPTYPQGQDYGQPAGAVEEAPITRAELASILTQQTQNLAGVLGTRDAQAASTREAEALYPQVYADPTMRESARQIWEADPALQRDPRGPEKAALLTLGLHASQAASELPASADARKQVLSGAGATVPAGNESVPETGDRAVRYNQALAHARATGRTSDFARARRIQTGQE